MTIREIELETNSIQSIKTFYNQQLELPVIRETEDTITFAAGYSTITFRQVQEEVGYHHFAFLIPENQIEPALQWVADRTPVLPYQSNTSIAEFKNWNAQAFYFHDPQQNILEFIVHHDLPNTAATAFSDQSIIGLCGIGVVVEDVVEACDQFNKMTGVPYFKKGPYLLDFAVMGTEEGLLIISKEGRGWIPTGQPAHRQYLKVVLELEGKNKELVFHWW